MTNESAIKVFSTFLKALIDRKMMAKSVSLSFGKEEQKENNEGALQLY